MESKALVGDQPFLGVGHTFKDLQDHIAISSKFLSELIDTFVSVATKKAILWPGNTLPRCSAISTISTAQHFRETPSS